MQILNIKRLDISKFLASLVFLPFKQQSLLKVYSELGIDLCDIHWGQSFPWHGAYSAEGAQLLKDNCMNSPCN